MNTAEPVRLTMIHVPKTAGNTILALLRGCFEERRVAPFLYEGKSAALDDPSQYDLIAGHIGFTMARGFGAPMITVLREPVDRTVSLFYFWRQQGVGGVHKDMTLEDFLRSDHPGIVFATHNPQTWQIAHSLIWREQRLLKLSDGALLGRAFRNLADIEVVGVTERLSEFISGISARFGLDFPPVQRLNRTKTRAAVQEISEESRALIMERTRLDALLYQYALSQLPKPTIK